MLFAAIWAVVLMLLALWSGLVWAAHALLTATLTHAGALGAGTWALPESLTAWLPPLAAEWLATALQSLLPSLQAVAGWLPSLSGGLTVLGWVVWGLGTLLLMGGAALAHGVLLWWRRSRRMAMPQVIPAMR